MQCEVYYFLYNIYKLEPIFSKYSPLCVRKQALDVQYVMLRGRCASLGDLLAKRDDETFEGYPSAHFNFENFNSVQANPSDPQGRWRGWLYDEVGRGGWGQGGWKTHLGLSPGVRQVLCHRPPPPPPQPPGCCYSKWLFLKSPDLSQILSRLLKNLRRAAQAKQSPRQEEFHKKRRKFKGEI